MERKGWLFKEGQIVKSWKRRWFVAKGTTISYYVNTDEQELKGYMKVDKDTSIIVDPREIDELHRGPFRKKRSFIPSRTLFISTPTNAEKEDWIKFLNDFIKNSGNTTSTSAPAEQDIEIKMREDHPDEVYICGQDDDDDNDDESSTPSQEEPFEPEKVVLGKVLGVGSFGTVYRANYETETIAVKVIQEQAFNMDREHLMREVSLLQKCKNKFIINFKGSYLYKNSLAIAMEFCAIGSLQTLIETKKITAAQKVKFALDTAKGMKFLHQNEIIHRDLKPDNLLVFSLTPTASVCLKLTDFGTGRRLGRSHGAVTNHVGTPVYMAPEMLRGEDYSFPIDVYSYAVSMWELWTQSYAYSDIPSEIKLLAFLATKRLPIPEDCLIADVISKSWLSNPAERPTFKDIVDMLKAVRVKL